MGAEAPTGFVTGTSIHTIDVGGTERAYRLYLPAGLPALAPLVVMLHGYSAAPSKPKDLTAGTNWPARLSSSWPIRMASTGPGTSTAGAAAASGTRRRQ